MAFFKLSKGDVLYLLWKLCDESWYVKITCFLISDIRRIGNIFFKCGKVAYCYNLCDRKLFVWISWWKVNISDFIFLFLLFFPFFQLICWCCLTVKDEITVFVPLNLMLDDIMYGFYEFTVELIAELCTTSEMSSVGWHCRFALWNLCGWSYFIWLLWWMVAVL